MIALSGFGLAGFIYGFVLWTDSRFASPRLLATCAAGAGLSAIAGVFWYLLHKEGQSRHRIAELLRTRNLLADAGNVGLWEWDSARGTFTVSVSGLQMLGYDNNGPASPSNWLALLHSEDAPVILAQIRACIVDMPAGIEANCRLRHANGSWRRIQLRGRAILEENGAPCRLVGVASDLTAKEQVANERQHLQDRLLESQRTESLGLLAGNIAHDFNNLLSGVLTNAELALLDLPPNAPLARRIEQMRHAAVRMADLSREMLAYSGRGAFNVGHVDLNVLVRDMSHLITASISKRVRLVYEFAPTPVIIEAESTQIRQVVMNLITNASDSMEQRSGIITLSTGIVEARATDFSDVPWAGELREGFYSYFEVQDTGCGMTPETIRRMFEPFFTTKPRGRGLGLAAAHGIIRNHHGALKVTSEPGRGTTFRVFIPLAADAPALSAEESADLETWTGHGTILVVDDDDVVREMAATLLSYAGFGTLKADSGEEAVSCVGRTAGEIRAVLLDATMPGMDGPDVVTQMRMKRPDLPVILMSGYSENEAMRRYSGVELQGFVLKPFEAGGLKRALRTVLPDEAAVHLEAAGRVTAA